MKNSILLIIVISCFISCNEVEKKTNDNRVNLLLPTSVPVSQLFVFDTINTDWQKGLLSANLISRVFEMFNKSELTVFDPNTDDTNLTKYTKEQVCNNLGVNSVPLNYNEIKGLFFKEEWFLDTVKSFVFEKSIISWSPVRYFNRNNEKIKKLVFKISGNDASEILAKNIIYEFNLEDTVNQGFVKNIDVVKLTKLLIDKAVSGNTKVYNPMNVDEELSVEQIKKRLGERIDTVITEEPETSEMIQRIIKSNINLEEIKSIVFIEDWYYNPKTYAIKKVVKGIAPVRHYYKFDEQVKSISFVMFLTNEKTKIF